MPAKSTRIQRIEAPWFGTQHDRAFDHGQRTRVSPDVEKAIVASLESWRNDGDVRRLWAGDARLWTGSDEAKWLGRLNIAEAQWKRIGTLAGLADGIRQQAFSHIVLLGMGGRVSVRRCSPKRSNVKRIDDSQRSHPASARMSQLSQ
jgi:hypothetical protein